MVYQLTKMRAKIARETMRREQPGARRSGVLVQHGLSQKHLQERLYSILPFLARHGLNSSIIYTIQ